jgi:CheY-like chemotaxis protein
VDNAVKTLTERLENTMKAGKWPKGQSGSRKLGKPRILSLDGCPEILGITRLLLEKSGYEVLATDDEAAATCLLCFSQAIDLFTENLERPNGVGGCEFLHLMKSHPKLRSIPVLIISGHSVEAAQRLMKTKGIDLQHDVAGYLRKPYTRHQLRASIESILQKVQSV